MNVVAEENKRQVISLLDEAYACRTNNLNQSSQLAKKALVLSRRINDRALIGKSLSELALFSMIKGEHVNVLINRKAKDFEFHCMY